MNLEDEDLRVYAEELGDSLSALEEAQESVRTVQRFLKKAEEDNGEWEHPLENLCSIISRPGLIDELCGHPMERSTEMDKLSRALEDILRKHQDYWVGRV